MTEHKWIRAGVALLLSVGPVPARAQSFAMLVARADTAEQQHRDVDAARFYQMAYQHSGFDPVLLALAAGAAARGGRIDLAFTDLTRAVTEGYLDDGYFTRDSDIFVLHSDRRWGGVSAELQQRRAALDSSLRRELLTLADADQRIRHGSAEAVERFGRHSVQGDSIQHAMDADDAPRLVRMKEIVAARGWPGRRLVADDGAHAAWLLVQHAPLDFQQRVLPLFLAAMRRGDARAGDGALLQDRVLVGEGKPQIYGTQMRFTDHPGPPVLDSIADERCVDRRRAAVGLDSLAIYLRGFGVTYTGPPGACRSP